MAPEGAARCVLRTATFEDVEPVAALMREAGDLKARSEAGWRWLFHDNPAHRRQDPPPPMGWVLERDGALHGYLGNIHVDYVLDGKPVHAATCTSYYVTPAARSESTRLMTAFFRQPGVRLFLSTTANAASEPVYRLFKSEPPADASFADVLLWVADDGPALRDVLATRGVPPALASVLGAVGSPASKLLRGATGFAKAPAAGAANVLTVSPDRIDARFDRLWETVSRAPGLRVKRDAATLRWYFSDPDAGSAPVVFAIEDAEGLAGYIAAIAHRPAYTPIAQLRILDLVTRPGAEDAIPTLLARAIDHARENKLGLVYSAPCGAALSSRLRALGAHAHRHEHCAHFLRGAGGLRTADVTAAGVWHATALDGDTPFGIEYPKGVSPGYSPRAPA